MTITAGAPPTGMAGPREALRHSLAITRRNLLKVRSSPGQILDAALMPVVFALIFTYVFGGAISGSSGAYRQFLMPGILALTTTITSRASGVGLNLDFGNGVMDRFRSLPMARVAVLAGRILADTVRMLLGLVLVFAFTLLMGFRVHTGPLKVAAALGIVLLFGTALSWLHALIGLTARSVETVQSVSMLAMVPLQFGSSIFVPPGTMPHWLELIVVHNPMTSVVDSARALLLGGPAGASTATALVWIIGMTAVLAPLSVRQFQRRS
ncbi:ABC transporter permease [Streptacidiphilus sp. PB12-B1b]|uniref:ABC transporter permease n=1 Tax=Streptacidiphilus sp. PB12-B1b TaxID=2705012 RepID=UPI0015FDB488|nr:ABC transporter permease [Streptacidiphilus sp. PB12-B1b]QMU77968.1 ABC transporter permease [Streptacidiphilus sp. PB12-B1b]